MTVTIELKLDIPMTNVSLNKSSDEFHHIQGLLRKNVSFFFFKSVDIDLSQPKYNVVWMSFYRLDVVLTSIQRLSNVVCLL